MDKLTTAALELMVGTGGLTTAPVDNKRAALALRAANSHPDAVKLILAKRASHRTWLTVKQRQWQTKPRNSERREQYVRCL